MTSIFNTSRGYFQMHVLCKFGDSSSKLWWVIIRIRKSWHTDRRMHGWTHRCRQQQYPYRLKRQGVTIKTRKVSSGITMFYDIMWLFPGSCSRKDCSEWLHYHIVETWAFLHLWWCTMWIWALFSLIWVWSTHDYFNPGIITWFSCCKRHYESLQCQFITAPCLNMSGVIALWWLTRNG